MLDTINPNNMSGADFFWFLFSAVVAVAIYHLVHKYALSKTQHVLHESRPTLEAPTILTHRTQRAALSQVYPLEDGTKTDIDIIAIHGLDTKSPETWTWVDRHHPSGLRINWLQDQNMLPSKAPRARILTCDWPADIFETSNVAPKAFEELARDVLACIERRPLAANNCTGRKGRPILFIASCIGGLLLMKTLVMAKKSPVSTATLAIVFLSTPFSGTSFQDVAKWAEPGLTACAWFQGKRATNLLDNLKDRTSLSQNFGAASLNSAETHLMAIKCSPSTKRATRVFMARCSLGCLPSSFQHKR